MEQANLFLVINIDLSAQTIQVAINQKDIDFDRIQNEIDFMQKRLNELKHAVLNGIEYVPV